MSTSAYQLGRDAGRRGLWFHDTLDRYRSEGLIARDRVIDFYRGYWGDLFDVVPGNGSMRLLGRGSSARL